MNFYFAFLYVCVSSITFAQEADPRSALDFQSIKQEQAKQQATIDANLTPQQGEFGPLTKWNKYPYEFATSYPFVKSLPLPDKIPDILEFIENNKDDGGGVPESQLPCLTRMSFDRLDLDDSRFDRLKAWRDWWRAVTRSSISRARSTRRTRLASRSAL